MDFDKWLQRFVSRGEKFLFRLSLVMVVALFIVQAAFINGEMRYLLNRAERMEGQPLEEGVQDVMGSRVVDDTGDAAEAVEDDRAVILKLVPPPEASTSLFVLVNERVAGQLDEGLFYLPVSPGDMLEVVGNVSGEKPAVIKIKEVHGDLKKPQPGKEIVTFGERELLGWVLP